MLKITSSDILSMKIVNGVIPEPEDGAHTDPEETAKAIKAQIKADLEKLMSKTPEVLVKYRTKKIREMGVFTEN